MHTIIDLYNSKITKQELTADTHQQQAIHQLHTLHDAINQTSAQWVAHGKLFKWSYEGAKPQGFYFYGTVGRGKSMLMDLFFSFLNLTEKRRVHFHSFMDELHERMHNLKTTDVDPIHQIACDIAKEARLLCFDEFYISNIADAMMLGRLFDKLNACGVIICATSNWKPEDLFTGGHNRVRFKPFIKSIENMMDVFSLGEGQDFRTRHGNDIPLFYVGDDTTEQINHAFNHFSAESALTDHVVDLGDFKLNIQQVSGNVVHATFAELCQNPLSPENYLRLAKQFDTIIIDGIPHLSGNQTEPAMRFVVLIDILYEAGRRVICSSRFKPEELCTNGDIAFAFQRTISRLKEMARK